MQSAGCELPSFSSTGVRPRRDAVRPVPCLPLTSAAPLPYLFPHEAKDPSHNAWQPHAGQPATQSACRVGLSTLLPSTPSNLQRCVAALASHFAFLTHLATPSLPPFGVPLLPSSTISSATSLLCLEPLIVPCHGVHRCCFRGCGPCGICRVFGLGLHLGVELREGVHWTEEQWLVRVQGLQGGLRPERQPRQLHAGVEPHGTDQVRDVLVLARPHRRPDRQAGGLHDQAESHPLPRVRREPRRCEPC